MNTAGTFHRRLIRSWLALVVLSALSTGLHLSALPADVTGVLILTAAWLKGRLILLDYLELRGVVGWANGIVFGLACFTALLTILFLAT